MKVAIVHDWLTVYAGAEKVLEHMLACWPDADLYALVDFLPEEQRGFLGGKRARTTFIQGLPFARARYRSYLPLMPVAIEQLDLSAYDVVVSSSFAVAKGVITGPDQLHVSYVHSPIRYAWDLQHQYLQEAGLTRGVKSMLARAILHYIRLWDARTANGVDDFIANSDFVARRIMKAYRRDAAVLHPPVDLTRFTPVSEKEDFYLTASRMVPYKRIPLIIQAFAAMPDKKLVVIGEGPEFERARSCATPNVRLLGYQPTDVLVDHMRRARAFVFAAEEDFGITPVEAQACGTPVIAFGKGGALETVIDTPGADRTGLFFDDQTVESICAAVRGFDALDTAPSAAACRRNAERFSPQSFRESLTQFVADRWAAYGAGRRA